MHFNKIRKQDAWEELGKEMNRPVDEFKKKTENLLSSLRREKMKMPRNVASVPNFLEQKWLS